MHLSFQFLILRSSSEVMLYFEFNINKENLNLKNGTNTSLQKNGVNFIRKKTYFKEYLTILKYLGRQEV